MNDRKQDNTQCNSNNKIYKKKNESNQGTKIVVDKKERTST